MDFTADQLLQYNGTNPSNPIYVAIKGRVFDVTTGKSFYGPGGSYAMFAGKDASRALAKMSKNDEDITSSLHGLTEKEIGVLDDWEKKFEAKYPVVGRVGTISRDVLGDNGWFALLAFDSLAVFFSLLLAIPFGLCNLILFILRGLYCLFPGKQTHLSSDLAYESWESKDEDVSPTLEGFNE
ncbi:hypothetical protein POTOM_056783 [Populus tomentosa]|uniref:Cytochrome b5 heme-binding domain-containing protein n=1 Tax=Populus tomentosa TaxID=118781 RepID=A0A8X7XV91_POPTO|nr:hypothetical protein POTOM_056783 [Populus tomentosa]